MKNKRHKVINNSALKQSSKMSKLKCASLILLLLMNLPIWGEVMQVNILFQSKIEKFSDIMLDNDKLAIAFPKKNIVYNYQGEEISKVEKLKKNKARIILLCDDKIVNLLIDQHLLQVYQDDKLFKEIDLREMGIIVFYSFRKLSDSKILLLADMIDENDDENIFYHNLISIDFITEDINVICNFGKEIFSLGNVFKQDPINAMLNHIILNTSNYLFIEKDRICISNFNNQILFKKIITFPIVIIDEAIKSYYEAKKPFAMKFSYPESSPRIYKLYPLNAGRYLIDSWHEKYRRIKNNNLKQFILYCYDSQLDTVFEVTTEYNPDDFKKITENKIAIYKDSELIIGEMIIKKR